MSGRESINRVRDLLAKLGPLVDISHRGTLATAVEWMEALLSMARFKEGDRVELTEAPIITERSRPGWLPYVDEMVQGAAGQVQSVDFWSGRFRYNVRFDWSRSGYGDLGFSLLEDELRPEGSGSGKDA